MFEGRKVRDDSGISFEQAGEKYNLGRTDMSERYTFTPEGIENVETPKEKGIFETFANWASKAKAWSATPQGFALYAGFEAFSTFAKIKARKEKNEADRKNYLDQAKRARDKAGVDSRNLIRDYEQRTAEQGQRVAETNLASAGIEEGTGVSQLLKTNTLRAKNAAQDIIKQGDDLARQYEQRAAAVDEGDTITDILDVGTGITSIVRSAPDEA